MAEAMQGAMPPPPQMGNMAAEMAAVEEMRKQVSPSEVNNEMLMAAEQADPIAVAEFRRELEEMEIPPEVLALLNTMVDEVLSDPANYAAIRARYMAQGVDEELLPEAFDAQLFGALQVALDQLRAPDTMAPPQNFAKGGIASLRPMAQAMADAGRNGDTMVAHISPIEAQILRRIGGSGTTNPTTGMPEFFLKKLFKKIGKTIKKFANTTIGKIVIGTALFMVAGPAATALFGSTAAPALIAATQGFVAGAGTSLIAGRNFKDSLKAGAIGAVTAGAVKGVTQGASAFKSTAAPTTGAAGAAGATGAPVSESVNLLESSAQTTPIGEPFSANAAGTAPMGGTPSTGFTPLTGAEIEAMNLGIGSIPTNAATTAVKTAATETPGLMRSIYDTLVPNEVGIGQGLKNIATNLSPAARQAAGEANAEIVFKETLARTGSEKLAEAAALKAMPNAVSNWLPLGIAGLGAATLGGAFEQQPATVPPGFEEMAAGQSGGARLLAEQPEKYGLDFGGVRTSYAYDPYQYMYAPPPPPPTYANPMTAADGGSAEYPRKNGHISGPGTGTSDDIPAMLSDGEFVFTAKAVRNMGDGSRRKGAKRMYALMKKLEGGRSNG
jgi:hypothetical protein